MLYGIINCAACGDDSRSGAASKADRGQLENPETDPSDALFALTHRVEIGIEMAPNDWQALRMEGRSPVGILAEPEAEFEYTSFDAVVVVDGVRYEKVGVRKKGFLGSLSMVRPSLKVDFDRNVKDQSHAGMRSLTLNNNRQDPSNTHQCLAYHLFARAGLPASRCNIAHVVANGEDLGTYSNVEAVNKSMLTRHFRDNGGNLYEGQVADFLASTVERLELKTNKDLQDRTDLQVVVEALEVGDDDLEAALSAAVDLESFRTFWAMETLIGHQDGYAGNANNFQVYHDPTSNRFFFLPWGTDSAFETLAAADSSGASTTAYMTGRVANRLYKIPAQRELYRQRLGQLNDTLWNEDVLMTEVDQIGVLATETPPYAIDAQRTLVQSHGRALRSALAQPAPEWADLDITKTIGSRCMGLVSEAQGTFRTSWGGTQTDFPAGDEFSLGITLDGKAVEASWLGKAGPDPSAGVTDPEISYSAVLPSGKIVWLRLVLPSKLFVPGVWPFHGVESYGAVGVVEGEAVRIVGLIGEGSITLSEAASRPDAPVSGLFSGRLVQYTCLDE